MDNRTGKKYKNTRILKNSDKALADLIDIFYRAKEAEGRSPRTLQMYREHVLAFFEYLDNNGLQRTLPSVTSDVLNSYMHWMLHSRRK